MGSGLGRSTVVRGDYDIQTFDDELAEPDELYGEGIGSNYQRQIDTLGKHFSKRPLPPADQPMLFEGGS